MTARRSRARRRAPCHGGPRRAPCPHARRPVAPRPGARRAAGRFWTGRFWAARFWALLLCALLGLLAVLAPPRPARADPAPLTVFAAASLKTALDAVAADFTARGGPPVVVAYAGSSALARQIQQGAPADLFLSANALWMDRLQAQGLIEAGSRRVLLSNRLVLVAPADSAIALRLGPGADLAGALGQGRLAMALVEAVPAGLYGRAALQALGLWDQVADRVAQADNVRAALRLVALGEAPLGVVYATDAAAEAGVRVVDRFDPATHPPIRYPVAILAGRDRPAARALLAYLSGPEAAAIFRAHGFGLASEAAR